MLSQNSCGKNVLLESLQLNSHGSEPSLLPQEELIIVYIEVRSLLAASVTTVGHSGVRTITAATRGGD